MGATAGDVEGRSGWRPFREPLRRTFARTLGIAIVAGAVVAWRFRSSSAWPAAAVLLFWFSFGGHWVELWFLNWLRPRIAASRSTQIATRLLVWFGGGALLGFGMTSTMGLFEFSHDLRRPAWWLAGLAFIAIELAVHAVAAMRGRPGFFDGAG